MANELPQAVERFRKRHPDVWKHYEALGLACQDDGPLDERTRRLVKLALAVGGGLEGAAHAHARKCRAAGWKDDELEHVALLALTTIGFPGAMRASCWIGEGARDQTAG